MAKRIAAAAIAVAHAALYSLLVTGIFAAIAAVIAGLFYLTNKHQEAEAALTVLGHLFDFVGKVVDLVSFPAYLSAGWGFSTRQAPAPDSARARV